MIIAYDQESHKRHLVSISVNKEWKIPDKAYVVSDAEREIENNADPDTRQLDLMHAIRAIYS